MGRGKAQHSLDLIDAAHDILSEIQPASIRAVCYRLFTRGVISNMSKANTNKVSTQLTWAREQGMVPWGWIVDETREAESINAWENPAAYVEAVKRSYRRDRWADQPRRIEVWSEKGTIRGTLKPVLDEYGVTFRVMHGYGSATAIYDAAVNSLQGDKLLIVYYVGDWDPSGLHMSDVDLPGRINQYGGIVSFQRIALTEYDTGADLPSFPADTKRKDPRYKWFTKRYGSTCWELDALDPNLLRERVAGAILRHIDPDAWARVDAAEAAESESLADVLNKWPGISGRASKYEGRA
jgi:hypothetical protein